MSDSLRIALAQHNFLVGDVQGNATRVIESAQQARAALGADLVLFPELTLSGYPPEDLLFHSGFRRQIEAGLARVCAQVHDVDLLLGFPEYTKAGIYNSAAYVSGGEIAAIHRKAELPNYKVFDEKRYFQPGSQPSSHRLWRHTHGAAGVRGHLGAAGSAAGARGRGANAAGHQCLSL